MTNRNRIVLHRLATWVAGGAVMLGAVAMALNRNAEEDGRANVTPVKLTVDNTPLNRDATIPASFSQVVKKVSPSVVQVYTSSRPKPASWGRMPQRDDRAFRWFFGPGERWNQAPGDVPMPRKQGVGSGVVVTADGYILTNNHVVDGADAVRVRMADGTEFAAKVIGRDPKSDVAVLKVDTDNLPHVELADSDRIEVGDIVLAVGNPFGIGQTVTMGMVSAKGRGNMGLDYEDFIQTDAAINPGNSGGALVDAKGRLIGVNTAILSRSGGNQGIGFAIPTNLARYVMEELVGHGHVARGYLGVLIQDVTPALAKEFDLDENRGALIADVESDGPADKAGLESGDVVIGFNGEEIRGSRQLKLEVAQTKPGKDIAVTVLRDGKERAIEVTLSELPGSTEVARSADEDARDEGTLNGVAVVDLDRRARQQLDAPKDLQGAVITEVSPNSAAFAAGLRPGDVIVEINRKEVGDAEDAVKLTEKTDDRTTLVRVWREGRGLYVVVDESDLG